MSDFFRGVSGWFLSLWFFILKEKFEEVECKILKCIKCLWEGKFIFVVEEVEMWIV